jgi:fibronectin type 3 domain-containing protein
VKPSKPGNFRACERKTGFNAYRLEFSWSPSTDNVGVSYYQIYKGTNLLLRANAANTVYYILAAFNSKGTYTVAAVDAAGNRSDKSTAVTVTVNGKGTEVCR